jgi:hypothetical protein
VFPGVNSVFVVLMILLNIELEILYKPDSCRRGSAEEMQMMQALWEDPSFRENFYKEYGDKLEALGYSKDDGKFPFGDGK